jgi:hypothetical protein
LASDKDNEQALIESYERAEQYREASERETKEQYHNSGLTYATLYQAENIRIANLLKEKELSKK